MTAAGASRGSGRHARAIAEIERIDVCRDSPRPELPAQFAAQLTVGPRDEIFMADNPSTF